LFSIAERKGFKTDAALHSLNALDRSNIIDIREMNSLTGKKMVLLLDGSRLPSPIPEGISTFAIAADSILQKKYTKLFREKDRDILLYSNDISVAAGVWMVLSQTGITNISILTVDNENETLKYE
jgi:hypothetical protein